MSCEKHIVITGCSEVSWKDAIVKTISDASKSLEYISTVKILDQRASINEDRIVKYFVDLDLSFTIDQNIQSKKDD